MSNDKHRKRYGKSKSTGSGSSELRNFRNQMVESLYEKSEFLIRTAVQFVPHFVATYNFPIKEKHLDKGKHKKNNLEKMFYGCMQDTEHRNAPTKSLAHRACMKETGKSLVRIMSEALIAIDDNMRAYYEAYPEDFETHIPAYLDRYMHRINEEARLMFVQSIERNPGFARLLMESKLDRRKILNMITDSIPERMPELYPVARSMKRHFVLHVGPTNSGKTYDALQALKTARNGIYLAPLRLLAYEIHDRLNQEGIPCNMITGEEEIIIAGAEHSSCTIETLSVEAEYEVAVIDECQMIGDERRGGAWSRALLGVCANTVHVCSDSSCVDLVTRIIGECGDTYEIHYNERMTPLVADDAKNFHFPQSVQDRDALIVFTKQSVIAVTAELQKYGIKASMIYGNLPYDVRMSEVKRFVEGETQVVVATDAIGMGLNLPIRRIVFLEMRKFDGHLKRLLTASEIKQIAGRAGRKGIFETGYFTSEYRLAVVKRAVEGPLPKVEKAVLAIPESIIYIDSPLSEILQRWADVGLEDIYEKADLSEDIELCRRLEPIVIDKSILYSFITLGFKSGKSFLIDMAVQFALIEQDASRGDIESVMNAKIDDVIYSSTCTESEQMESMTMEELEDEYLKYDLTYAYLRKFNHRFRMEGIVALKRECSGRIISLLKTQHLETRKCVTCGIELAWNYPYTRCERCYALANRY